MQARENRALFLIDLGVPRNISPDAAELYNTYLYNIDDLSGIVEQNKQARAGEVPRVEAIIDEHVAKFEAWQAGVEVSVVMRELREKLSRERDAFLQERFAASPDLSPAERERLAQLATEWIEQFLLNSRRSSTQYPRSAPQVGRFGRRAESLWSRPGQIVRTLRIGSRGSALAKWQAQHIAARLAQLGVLTEISYIKTSGDRAPQAGINQFGVKGVFIKEIEDALLDGRIDLAVHSLKDVPTETPLSLTFPAICEREDSTRRLDFREWRKA